MSLVKKLPQKPPRNFLPNDYTVTDWETLQPFYEDLKNRTITSVEALDRWFRDRSELESVLEEDMAWRYIKMTCNTADKALTESYQYFVNEIQPHIEPYDDALNRKAVESPYLDQLKGKGYNILVRELRKDIEVFREKNIPLSARIQTKAQEFGALSGAMMVEVDGKELTLQQAADYLLLPDREKREEVYRKIAGRRYQDREKLDALFDELIDLRQQVAANTDFPNYRDYMFKAMGRYDYTPQDCFDFHDAVAGEVVPVLRELAKERKTLLGVEKLRPWDGGVDPRGRKPLKPFHTAEELIDKSITCFAKVDPFLGECLQTMKAMGHIDLESRKGKAPGGYNYPLDEIGVPFIFMNATSTLRDLVTMVHEGGHAVHSFLTRKLPLSFFKHQPSEVAELASMSMELISMEHWQVFFEKEEDYKRAKREHLEQIIQTLPWVATIDQFQHWIYENKGHTAADRAGAWQEIHDRFSSGVTDWSGLESYKTYVWQRQLHLYEVPFYYIEYAIAQLGAVAVWKNYRENPEKGLQQYLDALRLGYTATIGEVYETAGIRFDFSRAYIGELMRFVREEMESCEA